MTAGGSGLELSLVARARRRMPSFKASASLGGPSAAFGPSAASIDRAVLRRLCVDMSKRGVLHLGIELEIRAEARESIEDLQSEVVAARKDLADGSPWDRPLEALQDACTLYRAEMRRRSDGPWVFGEELENLRVAALALATSIHAELKLPEATSLAAKIDVESAAHPLGPSRTIYVSPPDQHS